MRRPSHSAVLNDWSFAGGLPGRTARIEAVVVVNGAACAQGEERSIAGSVNSYNALNYECK